MFSSPPPYMRLMVDAHRAASIAFLVLVRQRGRSRKCLCRRRTGNTSALRFLLAQGPKPRTGLWTKAKLVTRRKKTSSLPAGNRGGNRWPSWAHLGTPARRRVGGLGMAADPWKQAAGGPGARQRGRGAGSNPVACDGKRTELWPTQGPPPWQRRRLQASRGSCGQWKDIGPRGTWSARGDHQQASFSCGGV